jgi:hypothetical protein
MSALGGIEDIALTYRYVGLLSQADISAKSQVDCAVALAMGLLPLRGAHRLNKADSRSSRHKVDARLL